MMKLVALCLTILLAAVTDVAGRPGDREAHPEDAQAIRAHIEGILDAYVRRDRERVRETHAAEWRGFLRPSVRVVRGIDEYMEAAEAALSGPYGLLAYRFLDYDIVFYGETAVVNYVAELEAGDPAGPARPKIRVLDVYAKIDGAWIQVASHTAPHPDTIASSKR